MKKSLSKQAQQTEEAFLNLKIANKTISCPYFNNKRNKVRAGIRARVGKGSPKEIKEEVKLLAKKEGVDLEDLNSAQLKNFMKDNNIGIDCSALAFYILDSEARARGFGKLDKNLDFSHKNFIRRLIAKIRSVENIDVKTLSQPTNSKEIGLKEIKPGDFISILDPSGDHIVIIDEVKYEEKKPTVLHYIHSFRWSCKKDLSNGVTTGRIEIKDPEKPIIEQKWIEKENEGKKNETYRKASTSKQTNLRRLRLFN